WILPGDAGLPSPRPEDPGRRGRAHPRLWVGARGLFREVHLYPAYSTAVLQALLLAVADPAISRPPPGGVGCAEIHADSPLHARGGDAGGSREIVGPRTGRGEDRLTAATARTPRRTNGTARAPRSRP